MENLKKRNYELSLWRTKYDVTKGRYTEEKVITIGSNTSDSPLRAHEPKLTRDVNGNKTLTFSMFYKYWDEDENCLKDNPFTKQDMNGIGLANESRVKLKLDNKWFDFIVKSISEDSSSYKFTYTCKDQNIYELSKTGFNIELSQDLMNNAGTVWQLGEKVLEGTDWTVDSSQSILFNKVREPLYAIDSSIIASQSTITADPDAPAYNTASAFYLSYTLQQQGDLSNQRLYAVFSDEIELDSDNVILNCHQYDCTINAQPASSSVSPYFGKRFVKNTPQIFDPVTQKMVTQYTQQSSSSLYYGYVEDKFYQPNLVDNFITNGKDFVSTKGWSQNVSQQIDTNGVFYLSVPQNTFISNTGLYDYRTKLHGIPQGEEFGLRIKYYGNQPASLSVKIAKDDSSYIVQSNSSQWSSDKEYLYKLANLNDPSFGISEEELETNIYRLYLKAAAASSSNINEFKIQEIELFKWNYGTIYTHNASGSAVSSFNGVICPSGYIQLNSLSSGQTPSYHSYSEVNFTNDSQELSSYYVPYASEDKKYYYYPQTQPDDDSLKICYEVYNDKPTNYVETRGNVGEYEKVKMVEAKESNRMAILQSLCEKFECWMDIEVQHDNDGTISVDEHGAPIKKIKFREYLDTPNAAGFKYGVNLKSVKRNIDSEQISTKIIVKPNSNEFADGGFCTISNASDCPTGENFFYNFDYYINKQGIERDKLIEDLYIDLYPQIKYYNEQIKQLNNEIIQFTPSLENVESKLTIANQGIANAPEEITEKIRLMQIHDKDIKKYHAIDANDKGIFNSDGTPWDGFQGKVTSVWRLIEGYYKSVLLLNSQYQEFQRESLAYKEQKKTIEQKINTLKEQIKGYQNLKENLINEFNKKYQPFIAEGNWTSEDYTDPNLYYYDQESVLYESSKPKISYTFDIINVSPLEGYEPYKFQPGDLTYVEDTEFFGWKTDDNGNRTCPYREEVVVYQLDEDLDNPMNDKVSVKTYKSQFEDLFQRIGNTTQNLTFNTGSYQRAAKLVDVNTGISTRALQQAFLDNADILNSIGNQNVTVDNQGITVLNQEDPNERVRIVNGGIFLSEDGGESWKTGITGKGINASEITTGTLNAGLINVSSTYSGRYYGNDGFKDVLAGVTKITEDGVKIFTNVPPDSQITQSAGGIEYKENPTSGDYGYRTYGQVESSGWQIGIRIPFSVNAQFYENLKEGKNNETLKQITEAKIKVTANWLSDPSAKTIEFDPYTQLYFKDEEQPWKDSWEEDDKIEVDFYDDQQGSHYLCFYFSQVGLRIEDDSSYKNLELEFSYKTALNPNSLLKESTALTLDGVVTKEVNTNIVKQSNISQTSGSFDTLKTSKIKQTEQESNSLELANGGYNCKLYVSDDGYFRIGVYSGQDLNYTLQARGDSSQIWQIIAAES